METNMKLIVLAMSTVASLFISRTTADATMEASAPGPALKSSAILTPSSPPSTSPSQELQDRLSPMVMLEPILKNFGFQELAMAIPSLSDSAYANWNGPLTLFAPTDTSIQSCSDSCSVPQLLLEHVVPGIMSVEYLRKLPFGTKLETMSPGRCITVTSAYNDTSKSNMIFIGGVQITQPDLFYNGLFVVHRLEGFISHLSPFSCNVERMSSLSFPQQPSITDRSPQSLSSPTIMHLMLKDAMLRLHNNGFSIVSLALRVKYAELANLHSMTVFALDDTSIFSGGNAYLSNFRFHVVPNRLLMNADLVKLPAGATLATLEPGQMLFITTAGGGGGAQMRINYIRIKSPDVMHNLKIVVHSVFFPFPHLHPSAAEYRGIGAESRNDAANVIGIGGIFQTRDGGGENVTVTGTEKGGCAVAPTPESRATV